MRMLVIVGVVLLIAGTLLWVFQRRLMYPGAWMPQNLTLNVPAEVERWERPISDDPADGVVEAWLIRGDGATAERPGPAVVFLHGNGEFIEQWPQELREYTKRGVTVLLPEYRGFARSAGSPSQDAIAEDVAAFTDRLAALPFVDATRLIYHGRSLGGGFAAQLATQRPPAAMILGSSFTSMADAAGDLVHVPRFMVRDRLEVEDVLRQYPGPVLILHGQDDAVVPVAHAQRNADAAADSTLIIYPDTGHNNMPRGHGRWEDIFGFLQTHHLLDPP